MRKAKQLVLSLACMLVSTTVIADEAKSSAMNVAASPAAAEFAQALLEQRDYAPRWRLSDPVETIAYSDNWPRSAVNVDFQESGALARLGKLRRISLLTFAEIGKARLFLGVDDNGIVGLHLRAFRPVGDERYLEVARMPYLEKDPTGNKVE